MSAQGRAEGILNARNESRCWEAFHSENELQRNHSTDRIVARFADGAREHAEELFGSQDYRDYRDPFRPAS